MGETMSWGGKKAKRLAAAVMAEYGNVCHLCQQPISKPFGYHTSNLTSRPDPDSFSVDHVLPRSKGGSDELENLRPAHYRCNLKRGNRRRNTIRATAFDPAMISAEKMATPQRRQQKPKSEPEGQLFF